MRRALVRVGLAAALLLALGLSGIMCTRVADRGRYATAYSTYSAGPEGGAVLRRIPYVDAEGERQRLGGLWLGARAAIVIDPN